MNSKSDKTVKIIHKYCSCDEADCPRHGNCKACQEYHRNHPEDGKTACGK